MKKKCEDEVAKLKQNNLNLKPTFSKFKKMLLDMISVQNEFRKNATLVDKIPSENCRSKCENEGKEKELLKRKQESAIISKSKRRFVGALLSKITPDQYGKALQEFNDAEKGKGLRLAK